jgi:hypothetical protein
MPIETARDADRNLTTHVVIGFVSEKEMHEVLEGFYDGQPTALVLWDMSKAQLAHVTAEMLQKFVRRAAKLGVHRRGGRTAVIAPEDLQYGLGRMSETFAEIESTPYRFSVFRSRQDAMQWLASDDTA